MTPYRAAIRAALRLHATYRELATSGHYYRPARGITNVRSLIEWYGTDPDLMTHDEYAGTYVIEDVATYRALAVLLAVAPIGGRTYLDVPIRTAVAASVPIAALGVAIGLALPVPDAYGDDGYPELAPAEYADVLERYEALRNVRSGGRFTEGS